jgi:hypothetical protein
MCGQRREGHLAGISENNITRMMLRLFIEQDNYFTNKSAVKLIVRSEKVNCL